MSPASHSLGSQANGRDFSPKTVLRKGASIDVQRGAVFYHGIHLIYCEHIAKMHGFANIMCKMTYFFPVSPTFTYWNTSISTFRTYDIFFRRHQNDLCHQNISTSVERLQCNRSYVRMLSIN